MVKYSSFHSSSFALTRLLNVNGKATSVTHPLLLLLLLLILLVEEFLLGSIKFHDLITQQAKQSKAKQASKAACQLSCTIERLLD
jgi:hypothetical protein